MFRLLSLTAFMFSFCCFFQTTAYAQSSGTFMVVKGDVQVTSKDGKTEKAKIGKKVFSSDTVVSGKDARAKIVMEDKNVINISPETKLILEKYIFDPAKNDKQVTLNVEYGKVRATVEQKYDGEKNKFHVKTPAAVAGVRGTDFLTSFNPANKQTKIVTFEGKVAVGTPGIGGRIMNPVFVEPGQFTTANTGAPPSAPTILPKEELVALNNDSQAVPTDLGGPTERAPASDGSKKDELKEDKGSKEPLKEDSKPEKPKRESIDNASGPESKEGADKPKVAGGNQSDSSGGPSGSPSNAPKGPGPGTSDGMAAGGPPPPPNGGPGPAPAPGMLPPTRAPTSAEFGPSMIDMKDIAAPTMGSAMPGMPMPSMPNFNPTSGMMPPPVFNNIGDTINGVIQNGATKVNIIIQQQ